MPLKQRSKPKSGTVVDHWLFRYGLALLAFGATIGLSLLLNYFAIKINLTIPVVFALVVVAWYGGRGPGLLISVLFQATTIIYAKLPEDSTPAKAWFGYFSVFSLYVFMTLLISGLRDSQKRLREQRDLLKVTLSSIGDAVIATDTGGSVTFMNPVAQQLTGWDENAARGRELKDVFRIVNEETGIAIANPVERALATGTVVGLANHTILKSKSGRDFPITDSAAPIRDGDKIKGVVLVFADVSEQKAAESARRESEIMHRIVEAQESERHRIARDLHDHLGQRMTALRLRIEDFTDKCGDVPGLVRAVGDLQKEAVQIDRDIGFLSWELRPTELEDLGLEDALRSFVREWSSQYGIAADFHGSSKESSSGMARLDHNVETNLYRIVQEALNNVLKHAGARSVSVLLQHRGDHLILIIEDDGLGFDRQLNTGELKRPGGLGLVGIHERAALLKGTLEIESSPGQGTTIMVRIPVST